MPPIQHYVAEFVGTTLLILLGDGVVANVVLNKSKGQNSGWIVITAGWGFAVAIAVYAVGRISGAHINPAVTVSLASIGAFPWAGVPGYILAQTLGAIVGSTLVWLAYLPHWRETEDPSAKLAVFCTAPAIRSTPSNFLCELIGTATLVFGILAIAANAQGLVEASKVDLSAVFSLGLQPLLVGILVFGIGLVVGNPYTENTNNTLDYNLVATPSGTTPEWQWKNQTRVGLAAHRAGSGQDANSTATNDALFFDPANANFHLRPKSLAIDVGAPAFTPAPGETDHDGQPRILDGRTDIGAFEFNLADFASAGQTAALHLDPIASSITYTRRADWNAQSLDFEIQTNPDLGPTHWTPTSGTLTDTVTPAPPDGTERVTYTLTLPSGPRAFARLRTSVRP